MKTGLSPQPIRKKMSLLMQMRRNTASPLYTNEEIPPLPIKDIPISNISELLENPGKSVSVADLSPILSCVSQNLEIESVLNTPTNENQTTDSIQISDTLARFQSRFPQVPNVPIEYRHGCAWERGILWQGRIYLTRIAFCFYAKIFGNEVKTTIFLKDIIEIEKANMAAVFPNAIRISTSESKYLFASFLRRDTVYEEMKVLWSLVTNPTSQIELIHFQGSEMSLADSNYSENVNESNENESNEQSNEQGNDVGNNVQQTRLSKCSNTVESIVIMLPKIPKDSETERVYRVFVIAFVFVFVVVPIHLFIPKVSTNDLLLAQQRIQEMEMVKMNHVQSAQWLMQEYNHSYHQLGELIKDW